MNEPLKPDWGAKKGDRDNSSNSRDTYLIVEFRTCLRNRGIAESRPESRNRGKSASRQASRLEGVVSLGGLTERIRLERSMGYEEI